MPAPSLAEPDRVLRARQVFVSSSAVGYYGVSETETFKESSKSGNDFLAEICRDWEGAANTATGVRTVIIRTGIVLAKEGGALAKMIPVFSIFTGARPQVVRWWCSGARAHARVCVCLRHIVCAQSTLLPHIGPTLHMVLYNSGHMVAVGVSSVFAGARHRRPLMCVWKSPVASKLMSSGTDQTRAPFA